MGLRMDLEESVRVLDPAEDAEVFGRLLPLYQAKVGRRGTPPDSAERRLRTRPTVAGAMLLEAGMAEACIAGGTGDWMRHWHYAFDIVGKRDGIGRAYALSGVIMQTGGTLFVVDTHLVVDPTPEQIAEMTCLAGDLRELGQPVQHARRAVGEVVDTDHAEPRGAQGQPGVRGDVAGGTGEQDGSCHCRTNCP